MPFSKRVLKEYCVSLSTPLSLEIVPLPSFKPPRQTADALRFMFALVCVGSEREFAPTRQRLPAVSFHLKRDIGIRADCVRRTSRSGLAHKEAFG